MLRKVIVEIRKIIDSNDNDNRDEPYYMRTQIAFFIYSTTKFDRIFVTHMGFRSWTKGKRWIYQRGGKYTSGVPIEPNGGAQVTVLPFRLSFENVGDGFLKVNVRLPGGTERCKVTILQEGRLPRQPKPVDDFVKVEDIWYVTATVTCLQTLRIEEIVEEDPRQ